MLIICRTKLRQWHFLYAMIQLKIKKIKWKEFIAVAKSEENNYDI